MAVTMVTLEIETTLSSEGVVSIYLYQHPATVYYNIRRSLTGSVGNDLEARFVTPYDVGWDFLVKFDHDFTGKAALQKLAENRPRTSVRQLLSPHPGQVRAAHRL